MTSLERTLADVLDRPSLAGGIEAVWRSLAALPAVDPVAVLASTLEALQRLLPGHPVYMERALGGRLNRRWRLIVPAQLAGPPEEAGA